MSEPTYAPQPAFQSAPANNGNGVGVAALVLGIIAVVVSIIPLAGIAAFPLGGIAVILGIVGLVLKGRKRGTSIAGLVLGVVSIVIAAVMLFVTAAALGAVGQELDKSDVLVLGEDWSVEAVGSGATVFGSLKNTGTEPVSVVATITFDVKDAAGKNTGTCTATTDKIAAGATWEFEAPCEGEVTEASEFTVNSIAAI